MRTLRVISALLRYPEAEVLDSHEEAAEIIRRERLLPREEAAGLLALLQSLATSDLMEAQADYIDTFERGRSTSLHLYEHIHGESRDRGQAMVDLAERYRRFGMEIATRELPDFLPLVLEFLSTRPLPEVQTYLGEISDILALIAARLDRRGSPYRACLSALLALAARRPERDAIAAEVAAEVPDHTPEALDRAWAEAPVVFADHDPSAAQRGEGCPAMTEKVARFLDDRR